MDGCAEAGVAGWVEQDERPGGDGAPAAADGDDEPRPADGKEGFDADVAAA